jgi:pyruvate dehydrogenase E1 component alpha subunit
MFEEYNPVKMKMFNIMDNDGKIINPDFMPELSDKQIIDAYKRMLFARKADLMAVSYQRQGRMYTYPPNFGQEAIPIGASMALQKEDWLVPAYRESGIWLAKGLKLRDFFLLWRGHEDSFKNASEIKMLPQSVPIASQLLHGVGIGFAMKYKGENGVVYTFNGDGGTSEGDFHEALNFAGVWKAPVVFIVQNNQYAISLSRNKQTAAESLAIKSVGYGIKGLQVDGNDFFAVSSAVLKAAEHARAGNGPVLLECVTYRRGAHTTSDDPGKYRSEEEEKKWAVKDPVDRLRKYLVAKNLWNEKDEEPLLEQYKKEIDSAFSEAENYPEYKLKDVFQFHYNEMPDDLKKQMVEYEKFLNWKETKR